MHVRTIAAVGIFCCALCAQTSALRVYYLGNSLTDCLNYSGFKSCAQAQSGQTVDWGRHMIPGTPLLNLWNSSSSGISEPPYGLYPSALTNYTWDVITMQPYDWLINCSCDMDEAVGVRNFATYAKTKSPNVQLYVYACWPERPFTDYQTAWMAPFTNGWKSRMKGYYDSLTLASRKLVTGMKSVLEIPNGHTMYELDKLAKAGKVPGISSAIDFYSDNTHLNSVGSYVVAATTYATLFKKSPVGMPATGYSGVSAELARVIQETAWSVVSTYPLSGVTATAASRGHVAARQTAGRHVAAVYLADGRVVVREGAGRGRTVSLLGVSVRRLP